MNVYANIFYQISEFFFNQKNVVDAKYFYDKAVEFNTKNLQLNQTEIDDLIEKYGNKSIDINRALLSANMKLIESNQDNTNVILLLTEKYFCLEGLGELFLKAMKTSNQISGFDGLINYLKPIKR